MLIGSVKEENKREATVYGDKRNDELQTIDRGKQIEGQIQSRDIDTKNY